MTKTLRDLDVKIFTDENFKNELKFEEGKSVANLGTAMAGETTKFNFYIKNDGLADLVEMAIKVIVPKENRHEIKVVDFPTELNHKNWVKFVIEWTPNIDLQKGLKLGFEINANGVYRG